jgi:hypothetical protein
MEKAQIDELAAAYIEYTVWFLTEGMSLHQSHSETMRQELSGQFSKMVGALRNGPEAMLTALNEEDFADMRAKLLKVSPPAHPCEWARDKVGDVLRASGLTGWEVLKAIVRHAPDDPSVLGFVGAGPFEDWVGEDRAREVEADLEAMLRKDPKFRVVVSSSWRVPETLREICRRCGVEVAA